jgi:hypothetical protein
LHGANRLSPIPPLCVHQEVRSGQQPAGLHGGAIVGMIVDHQLHPMPMKLGLGVQKGVPRRAKV